MKEPGRGIPEASVPPLAEEERVAVVVPCFNEARFIGPCLDALRGQDPGGPTVRVLVVDNGSTDETPGIVRERGLGFRTLPGISISALRNRGAEGAREEFLGFVDADCLVSPRWAERALAAFRAGGATAGIVGAPYTLPEGCSWIERAWDVVSASPPEPSGEARWLPAGNMVVRREAFERVGGFDETLATNEDVDLCERIREAGYRILRDDGVGAVHLKYTTSLGHFFRRQRWHGRGAWEVTFRSLPAVRNGKVAVLVAAFLASLTMLAGGLLLQPFGVPGAVPLVAALGVVAPPVLAGVHASFRRGRGGAAPALSLLFLVYAAARTASLLEYLAGRERKR